MIVLREQVVQEARSWLGTPYQHQGRLKGVAVDCIGLLACVAHALGLSDADMLDYGKRPDGRLRPTLEEHLESIPILDAYTADVLLFSWSSVPVHIGILTSRDYFIHAYLPNRKVVESRLDATFRAHVTNAYHIPGVV
jgi:NlpC/P60 family putative phage cell wall peptidase